MGARERSLRSQLTRLSSGQGLMDGSVVERHRRCGKPTCRCARDPQALHRSVYLFRHEGGRTHRRTHQLYIPARWEGRVRQWIDNYHELRRLTRELCELHWQKVREREGEPGKGRKQGEGR
jgi:hypothetical protein